MTKMMPMLIFVSTLFLSSCTEKSKEIAIYRFRDKADYAIVKIPERLNADVQVSFCYDDGYGYSCRTTVIMHNEKNIKDSMEEMEEEAEKPTKELCHSNENTINCLKRLNSK